MSAGVRRLVTGLDDRGRSTVLFDDRVELDPGSTRLLWQSDALPADNGGSEDTGARDFGLDLFGAPGGTFLVTVMQPGEAGAIGMHATDTLDHLVVLNGRIELRVETGSVTLGPGDCIVDRGVRHAWKVIGDEPVVMTNVLVPSKPVGAGATI